MAQLTASAFERGHEAAVRRPLDLEPGGREHLRKAWIALGISVLGTLATAGIIAGFGSGLGAYGFGAVTLVAFVGAGRGVAAAVRAFGPASRASGLTRASALLAVLGNGFMVFLGSSAALISTMHFTRGRQLRRRGRVLLAPVESGAGWQRGLASPRVDAPPGVAAQWRENGRTEHASVAAFARLTLDLLALGAPARLVAGAQRDALDEIRHTELCFDLATRLDGAKASPGPFPEASRARTLPADRTLALAVLAVDSLIDGALNEGVSARIVARLARRAVHPAIRTLLLDIAADEGRHAAHGWDIVLYCLAEGGKPVLRALQGAVLALPERMSSSVDEAARRGEWEPWGIPGAVLENAEFQKARDDLQRRIQVLASPRTEAPLHSALPC